MKSERTLFSLLIVLYFSQGLPSGLLAHSLPALMREFGVNLSTISLLKLLALPWFFKFLWAPFIDRSWQKKYWIISFQSFCILLLVALSFIEPHTLFSNHLTWLFICLFFINLACASQDIATDGIAASAIQPKQLGIANSIQVGAYKVGLIGGGTLMLIYIEQIGWQTALLGFALLLSLALIPILTTSIPTQTPNKTQKNMGLIGIFSQFIAQAQIKQWLLIVLSYKIADALGSSMIKPLLIDSGLSLTDIGILTTTASISGIAGAITSGLLLKKLSLKQGLMLFGCLQALAIGSYALINSHTPIEWIYAIALIEQFTDGLSTVALFAGMMHHCRKGLEGTDYTVQNSLLLTGSGMFSLGSGFIAENLGYETLFLSALTLGLLTMLFIIRLPHQNIQAAK